MRFVGIMAIIFAIILFFQFFGVLFAIVILLFKGIFQVVKKNKWKSSITIFVIVSMIIIIKVIT
jgi:hypothetical protein